MSNRRRFIGFILLGMVSLLLSWEGAAVAANLEKTKLKVGVSVPSVAFLPLYVGVEEKLFQNEGLEVEVLAFRSTTDNTSALASKSIDINATGFEGVLTPRNQGLDIKMFYALCNRPVYQWYSKPEIKSIKEAKGKKFAVSKIGSPSDVMTRWVVRKAGLDPAKDIQILQVGAPLERLSALVSGGVDVAILSEPGTFMAERKGYNLLLSLDDFIKGFPLEVYASFVQFIKANPETLKAFLRGNNKAIEVLRANQEKALSAIKKYLKVEGEDAVKAYQGYRDSYPIDGVPPLDGIDMVQEITVESGEMKSKLPLTELIDYTYINFFKK